MKSISGSLALITGASSGIGESFARELAKEGANLVLVARSMDKLHQLADELRKAHKIEAHVYSANLGAENTAGEIHRFLEEKKLQVDLLVNNAGIGRAGNFEAVDAAEDQKIISLNVNSLVALTHYLIPNMLKRGQGGIINVASTASFQALPYLTVYAATKAFVLSFSTALWGEYQSKGIRVLCLCPGNTITNFHERAGIKKSKIFFPAQAEDVARHGINIFLKSNKPVTVYKFPNQLLAFGTRLVPRAWAAWIGKKIYRNLK